MFSAIDGFRYLGSPAYVAIYTSGDDPGVLSFYMNTNGNGYIGGTSSAVAPVVTTDFTGYITKSRSLETDPQQVRFIQPDSTGNVYVGGLFNISNNDAYLVKLDSNLDIVWQKTLVGPNISPGNSDVVRSGVIDSSDNIIINGYVDTPGGNVGKPFLSKYNSSGTLIFSKTFSNVSQMIDIAVDSTSNIYTLGVQQPTGNVDGIVLEKLYSNGDFIWRREFIGTTDVTNSSEMAIDGGGNIYISIDTSFTGETAFTMLDSSGAQQWTKQLRQASNTLNILSFSSLTCDGSNVYGLTTIGSSSNNVIFLKYDNTGNKVWERNISTTSGNLGYGSSSYASAFPSTSGYVATAGPVQGTQSMCVIKIPADGSETGVYGNITYANSSLTTTGTVSVTFAPLGDNTSNITLTETTPTWTSNAYAFTYNITAL
jgi:hypothetical protein